MGRKRSRSGRKSSGGVLQKAADAGAALASPVRAWQTAREETQQIADVLPDTMGLGRVRHFIHRHPLASAGAALVLGYLVFGSALPYVGGALRLLRGRG